MARRNSFTSWAVGRSSVFRARAAACRESSSRTACRTVWIALGCTENSRNPRPTRSGVPGWPLAGPDASVRTRLTSTVDTPDQHWLVRARGTGVVQCDTFVNGATTGQVHVDIDSPEWMCSPI